MAAVLPMLAEAGGAEAAAAGSEGGLAKGVTAGTGGPGGGVASGSGSSGMTQNALMDNLQGGKGGASQFQPGESFRTDRLGATSQAISDVTKAAGEVGSALVQEEGRTNRQALQTAGDTVKYVASTVAPTYMGPSGIIQSSRSGYDPHVRVY